MAIHLHYLKNMKDQNHLNPNGMSLIELLVALVICSMVIAGIYRVFIAQSKAYTVQDQVVEVQQNIRSAMEILLRDLRMAGYDDDNINSPIIITNSIATPIKDDSITVTYEYYDKTAAQYQKHTIAYWRDAAQSIFLRQLTVNDVARPQEILLENVDALNFTYGVDTNEDGALDHWVSSSDIGIAKVIGVQVTLTARPVQVNPDIQMISPRSLVSNVTLRNLCLIKSM